MALKESELVVLATHATAYILNGDPLDLGEGYPSLDQAENLITALSTLVLTDNDQLPPVTVPTAQMGADELKDLASRLNCDLNVLVLWIDRILRRQQVCDILLDRAKRQ